MRKVIASALVGLAGCAGAAETAPIPMRVYGGGRSDVVNAAIPLEDGGFLLVGDTRSLDGDLAGVNLIERDTGGAWAFRIDANGEIVWQLVYGERKDGGGTFRQAMEMDDGTFLLAYSHHDMQGNGTYMLLLVSAEGEVLREKPLEHEYPFFFQGKGGLLMFSPEEEGCTIELLSGVDESAWQVDMPEELQATGASFSSFRATEDGYLVCGSIGWNNDADSPPQAVTALLSDAGELLWFGTVERPGQGNMISAAPTEDGGVIAAGDSINYDDPDNTYITFAAAFGPDGTLLWDRDYTFGDTAMFDDLLRVDDGFLALGTRAYTTDLAPQYELMLLDADGNELDAWSVPLAEPYDALSAKLYANDGHLYVIDSVTTLPSYGELGILVMPVDAP